ncbi:hypothetical protein PR048_026140 [Dryococelus australis]|uniref:Uncharacterized protein n=1 Tax=Dryococelus australis TaxID=614101 RepID=A0ABQ9GKK0_9NEOP|nr:hypothetical protein PR048_026140 [Dryococelus australis]
MAGAQPLLWAQTPKDGALLLGRDGVVIRLLAFHLGEPGSIPSGVASRISASGNRAERCRWLQVFSGFSHFFCPSILGGGILLHLRADPLHLQGKEIMQGDMQIGIGQLWPAIGATTTSLSILIAKTITKKRLGKIARDNVKTQASAIHVGAGGGIADGRRYKKKNATRVVEDIVQIPFRDQGRQALSAGKAKWMYAPLASLDGGISAPEPRHRLAVMSDISGGVCSSGISVMADPGLARSFLYMLAAFALHSPLFALLGRPAQQLGIMAFWPVSLDHNNTGILILTSLLIKICDDAHPVLQAPSRTVGFTRLFHTLSSIEATNTSLAVVHTSLLAHIRRGGLYQRLPAAGLRQGLRCQPISREHSCIVAKRTENSSRREEVCDASKSRRCRHSRDSQKGKSGGSERIIPGRGEGEVSLRLRRGAIESVPAAALGLQWLSGQSDSKWGLSGSVDRDILSGIAVTQWIELYQIVAVQLHPPTTVCPHLAPLETASDDDDHRGPYKTACGPHAARRPLDSPGLVYRNISSGATEAQWLERFHMETQGIFIETVNSSRFLLRSPNVESTASHVCGKFVTFNCALTRAHVASYLPAGEEGTPVLHAACMWEQELPPAVPRGQLESRDNRQDNKVPDGMVKSLSSPCRTKGRQRTAGAKLWWDEHCTRSCSLAENCP